MAVVLFLMLPFFVALIPAFLIGLFTAALAFYPVNNRPFSHFLEGMYNHYRRKRLYLWQQTREIVHKETFAPNTSRAPIMLSPLHNQKKDITSLARRLELKAMEKKDI
jgi:hypothetical protein